MKHLTKSKMIRMQIKSLIRKKSFNHKNKSKYNNKNKSIFHKYKDKLQYNTKSILLEHYKDSKNIIRKINH